MTLNYLKNHFRVFLFIGSSVIIRYSSDVYELSFIFTRMIKNLVITIVYVYDIVLPSSTFYTHTQAWLESLSQK